MIFGRQWTGILTTFAVAALLIASSWVAQGAETKTLEGTVGDVMCGLKHQMGDMPDKECTTKCVGMGSKYALIVGNTVYELDGKSSDLEKLAGGKAKVTGTVDGKKVKVTSVAPVQ